MLLILTVSAALAFVSLFIATAVLTAVTSSGSMSSVTTLTCTIIKNNQECPVLIGENGFTSSVNLMFTGPRTQTADVHQVPCDDLTTNSNPLDTMYFPPFIPPPNTRGGFNYMAQLDLPINLGPGSNLTYQVYASSTQPNPGCLRLCLIESKQLYDDFRYHRNSSSFPCSSCVNVTNTTDITFPIAEQGNYYVAYDTPGDISIRANISGVQTYYNIPGLAKSCPEPLSHTNPTCSINLCGSLGFCFSPSTPVCLIALASSQSNSNITYQTQNVPFASESGSAYTFIFAIVSLLVLLLSIPTMAICIYFVCKMYRNSDS